MYIHRSCAVLGIGILTVAYSSVSQAEPPAAPARPALVSSQSARPIVQKTTFDAVAKHLDPGGTAYFYLSTESLLPKLSATIDSVHSDIRSLAPGAKDAADADLAFTVATGLIQRSGIEQIGGVGFSSIAIQPDVFRNVLMIQRLVAKQGFLWKLTGRAPHPLDTLKMLPENTAVAGFWDVDFKTLWETIRSEAKEIGGAAAVSSLDSASKEAEKNIGMSIETLTSSLDGEYGFILTLDESKKVSVPIDKKPMQIADPALAIVFKCSNPSVFDKLVASGPPNLKKEEKNGVRIVRVPIPMLLPDGPDLAPLMAATPDYLFICSNEKILNDILDARSGSKPNVTSTEFYKKYSQGIPDKGNGFQFAQQSFGKQIAALQTQIMQGDKDAAKMQPLLRRWSDMFAIGGTFSVMSMDDEGLIWVTNSAQDASMQLSLLGAVAPAAVLGGIAAPNFQRARTRSEATRVLEELRLVDSAVDQWAIEKNKKAKQQPKASDLLPYIKNGRLKGALQAAGNGTEIDDIMGNKMKIPAVDELPHVPTATYRALSKVAPAEFWKPFPVEGD